MALSCGSKFAKCILFVFNAIFWICGAVILGIGIWALVDTRANDYIEVATIDIEGNSVQGSAVVLIIVGVIMFIVGGFGCLGACRESSCMLMTYAILLGILLIIQIIGGILAVVFRNKITDELESSMVTSVQTRYGTEGHDGLTDAFDYVQYKLDCCGAQSPSDWNNSTYIKDERSNSNATFTWNVPETCCALEGDEDSEPTNLQQCQADAYQTGTSEYVHKDGCYDALKSEIEDSAVALIGVAFGLLAVQLFGLILACCLKNRIQDQYNTV